LDDDDEPAPIPQSNEEKVDQEKKGLPAKALEKELFSTSPSISDQDSSTTDGRDGTKESVANTGDFAKLNREPDVTSVSVVVVDRSRNNSTTPRRHTQSSATLPEISIPDSQEPESSRESTPEKADKGKGKSLSDLLTYEMVKGVIRRKPPTGRNGIDPLQMQRLLGKVKPKGSDAGLSLSVESTPATQSPPKELEKKARQLPKKPPAAHQKAPSDQTNQGSEDVFAVYGYNGPKASSPISPEPGSANVGTNTKSIPSAESFTPKSVSQPPIYINLDSDDEETVPQTLATGPARCKSSPTRKYPTQMSQTPDMNNHTDVDPVEDRNSSELDFNRAASRPRMADYRSFKPSITKSNMLERYGKMGSIDPDPYPEVTIDWTRNSEVIDKLLNDDRVAFNPEYQMNWDKTVLPDLERRSEVVERNYFGNEYLEALFSFNVSKGRFLETEPQNFMLTVS